MIEAEFKRQIKTLLIGAEDNIASRVDYLLKSGALDIASVGPDDFSLAKPILYIILRDVAENFRPLRKEGQDTAENLEKP